MTEQVESAGARGLSVPGDVIVLDGVSKHFGSFTAVEEADFAIRRGEFFSMLGPSGCGKTTTLRMIAGFESPTRGRILLEGHDVSQTPPYRRNVNTVFQQYALFPHMSVYENVAFGLRSRKVPKDQIATRVARILGVVRMAEMASRRSAQLSGGQQQRVALARALVNEPAALLLDEPLAALDLKLRQAMQLELKRIQRETAVTFVFVTHDQQEALTMSDRIAVMSDGRVEQIGTPEEIYHRPATAFVASFIGEANFLAGTVRDRGDDQLRVALGDTIIPVDRPGWDVQPGDGVLVMVRPENVRVAATPPPAGRATIEATVTEMIFRGPSVRIELRTTTGVAFVANTADSRALQAVRPGEPVWVTWDRDAAYVVPAQEVSSPHPAPTGGAL